MIPMWLSRSLRWVLYRSLGAVNRVFSPVLGENAAQIVLCIASVCWLAYCIVRLFQENTV